MAPSYDRFAPHFDAWQEAHGASYDTLILPRIRAVLVRHGAGVRRIADLGAGTGDLVVALARDGYQLVAVDCSAPMLEVARAKAAAAELTVPPTFVLQDIRTLRLAPPVDAALCVYTVINQLTGDGDLARALTGIHDALVPGGLFVFEVNLPESYERYWSGTQSMALPDGVVTREHHRHGEVIEARITIRRQRGAALEEVEDHIAQRPYRDEELDDALARAEFVRLERLAFNPFDRHAPPAKALWCARRR